MKTVFIFILTGAGPSLYDTGVMENKRPVNYRTRQGQCILDYLKSAGGGHVTVNQIVRHFEGTGDAIGQTTVYRHLEKLMAEGKIRKYLLHEDKSTCYQYTGDESNCREHFHLKCENCGSLFHLDCDFLDRIERHLLNEHDFQINIFKTVFYGTCKKCIAGAQIAERTT